MHDPLTLRGLSQLQSSKGDRIRRRHLVLSLFVGLLDGLALLTLFPLTRALGSGTSISAWIWVLLATSICAFVLRFYATMASYHSALDFLQTAHTTIGDKLAALPLGWFQPARTGGLSRLVSDKLMNATSMVAHLLGTVFRESSVLVTLLVGAWFWDRRLGLTLLLIAPVAVAVMWLSRVIRTKASNAALPASKDLSSRIVEFASRQPALRAAGRSEHFDPLHFAIERDHKARVRELWQSVGALLINGIVVQVFVVSLITVTAHLAGNGELLPLETVAIIGMSLRFTRSLESLGQAVVGLDVGRIAISEAETIINSAELPEPSKPQQGDNSGSVELCNVTFGYDDTPVLHNVSFAAQPGTVTAIVGPSGSGKTTIARLISRFWDVDSGEVLVDGVDIRKLGTTNLMAKLSMVFQDVYLFDDTLIANIWVGRPEATEQEVRQAAKLAGVTAIAERLGWDTPVGEGGRLLSGGERQRVSVARALLKRAPIVLFDEATSALDAENEANVLAAMDELRKGSTFIVIAHKLDTIRSADQIVVLDDLGHVSQVGTHDELYAVPGVYQLFWQRREAAKGWTLD